MAHYDFQLYHRPGLYLSIEDKRRLKSELHALGSVCLDPLPDYQVFSSDPVALDDKAVVTAHSGRGAARQLVGFTSAVLLDANVASVEDPILHTGLTVIAPSHRQNGLPVQLFTRLFVNIVARYSKMHMDDEPFRITKNSRSFLHICSERLPLTRPGNTKRNTPGDRANR